MIEIEKVVSTRREALRANAGHIYSICKQVKVFPHLSHPRYKKKLNSFLQGDLESIEDLTVVSELWGHLRDVDAYIRLRNSFVENNYGLVVSLLDKIAGEFDDDLLQQSMMICITAVDYYLDYAGTSFSTYLSYWMKKQIYAYRRAQAEGILAPSFSDVFAIFEEDGATEERVLKDATSDASILRGVAENEVLTRIGEALQRLSPEERKVLIMTAKGRSSRQIASYLRKARREIIRLQEKSIHYILNFLRNSYESKKDTTDEGN